MLLSSSVIRSLSVKFGESLTNFLLHSFLDVLHISRQSCYLMGRDRAVADIPIDHTSISKQHAVIQFRKIRERNEFGDEKQSIKWVV